MISCICPTADRPKLVRRAIDCWRLQTYAHRELIIYDTGIKPLELPEMEGVRYIRGERGPGIGTLRNLTIQQTRGAIISNWDDDDWRHPCLLAEQLDLLSAHDAEIVGYRTAVFYDSESREFFLYDGEINYAIGASLMYRRTAWENRPFPALRIGEDNAFIAPFCKNRLLISAQSHRPVRIICVSHGANTCQISFPDQKKVVKGSFTRIQNHNDIAGLNGLLKSTRFC